jgi:uracil-DNA glycosylase family 4
MAQAMPDPHHSRPADMRPEDALRWYLEAGVDEAIGTGPVDRFSLPEPKPKVQPKQQPAARPGPARFAEPEPSFFARDPAAPKPTSASTGVLEPADVTAASARELAQSCRTLAELNAAIEGFEGCPLKKTAMTTVFADGDPGAGLMFIGEAPGAEEDRRGLPFVGRAGMLLDKMLAAIGRDRKSAYISNILPWRPPGNRTPTPNETTICLPFIRRHIELARPKVIVFLGGTSAGTLLDRREGITKLRGRWFSYETGDSAIPAMPTYHPAYLLRQPALKQFAWRDLLEIRKRLDVMTSD